MDTYDVVVGATLKELRVPIVDSSGTAIDITGATLKLQGKSADLPGVTIDYTGSVYSGAGGIARFTSLGSLVTTNQLGTMAGATFIMRVKFTIGGLVDYTSQFALRFLHQPI